MNYCIACKHHLTKTPLFTLKSAPASAQDIPAADQLSEDTGVDLSLYQCPDCGLVQFSCEPVAYYRDVIRAGGFTTTMTGLRRRQYRHLLDAYGLSGKRFLEVGCGRGEFLKVLSEFPVEVYGMEHRSELVKLAQEDGLCVWQEFPEKPDQVFGKGIHQPPFDVFLSFNFLEHQPRPDVMLQAIYNNLAEDGMGLVTVPALEYILEKGSYYELIRDHLAYYSFGTLRKLLESQGFEVLEEELINRDTLSMIVRKRNKSWRPDTLKGATPVPTKPLADGFAVTMQEIDALVRRIKEQGLRLAIWGASHQGFTLASTTALGSCAEYMIDSAPFKQGKFSPASHLEILSPKQAKARPADVILIAAPGYTDEIAASIRENWDQMEILAIRSSRIERL